MCCRSHQISPKQEISDMEPSVAKWSDPSLINCSNDIPIYAHPAHSVPNCHNTSGREGDSRGSQGEPLMHLFREKVPLSKQIQITSLLTMIEASTLQLGLRVIEMKCSEKLLKKIVLDGFFYFAFIVEIIIV
jgi:hypothetical protein